MKCTRCNKPIREDTDGNDHFCQGHSIFESYEVKFQREIEEEEDRLLEQKEQSDFAKDEDYS